MRLGSQTHSVEMEQRYVPLSFTAGAGTLTASVPANVNTAVPGVYMLFIVDSAGVPSVARMVSVDAAAPPPPRLRHRRRTRRRPCRSRHRRTEPASPHPRRSRSPRTQPTRMAGWSRSSSSTARPSSGEDTSAPYTTQWNSGAAGSYTLTARVTDNAGATTTSSPVIITVKKKR